MAYHLERPADAVNAAFFVSAGIKIQAPAAHVFDILIRTSTWPEWNTFCPKVTMLSPKSAVEDKQGTLLDGAEMAVEVRMKAGSALQTQNMKVTHLERRDRSGGEKGVCKGCWKATGRPNYVLRTSRTNECIDLDDAEDSPLSELRTFEVMNGPAAYAVKSLYGAVLQDRFEDFVKDLKAYAEKTWHEG